MELIIAFIIAMVLLWLAAEPETLADYSDRMHVNRLADRSRARKAPGPGSAAGTPWPCTGRASNTDFVK